MADQAIEVFTDGGSTHQRLPNGIRDNARENRKGEAQKLSVQVYHLLSGGSRKKVSHFLSACAILASSEAYKCTRRLTNGGNKETSRTGGFFVGIWESEPHPPSATVSGG